MNSTNITDFDYAQCTYATCDVTQIGQVEYIPSLAGNAFYLAVFAAVLVCQLGFAIRYHTWGYFIGMFCGLALEIIGYAARILLHYDAFDNNDFIIYLVGLTLGPAFFSASIYLCLGRIIAIYGRNLLVLSSRTITIAFCCFDLVSLILQACGGALVSLAINDTLTNAGLQIMIAGLSTQVASTTLFSCVCLLLILAIRRNPDKVNPNTAALRYSPKFRFFLFAIGVANTAILIRCCFRVAELNDGFHSKLANNEVSFMILDGAMMVIATVLLTIAHPGMILGSIWKDGAFQFRKTRATSKSNESLDSSTTDEKVEATGVTKVASAQV